jgi:hypothetical protein
VKGTKMSESQSVIIYRNKWEQEQDEALAKLREDHPTAFAVAVIALVVVFGAFVARAFKK